MTPITYFEDIYDSFLSKITTYEYLNMTDEELDIEFKMLLKGAMAKFIVANNIKCDYDMECFNRELTDLEIEIIAYGMIIGWVSPKIKNVELLKQSLSSKDYTFYSQSQHLKELIDLKNECESDFHYWMKRYDMQQFRLVKNNV